MRKVIFIVLAIWSSAIFAQVPVVEAGTSSRGQNSPPPAATGGGSELIITLYNQLEALQQEVQTLRGRVEEQDYQIKRMQTEQRDRYLDIDRRLSSGTQPAAIGSAITPIGSPPVSALPTPTSTAASASNSPSSGNAAISANIASRSAPQDVPPVVTNPTDTAAPSAGIQMDEQELYRTALNLLLEQSNYEQSILHFQTYISTYPKGRYLTNSYYWQGEAFILLGKFSEARGVFSKIINEFPQDAKSAGAMLKLGVVYEEMGETDQARKTWQEIAVRYPESTTEIREAENHLRGQ